MSRVLVAGSINMDLVVTAVRHPRPGETVPGKGLNFFPGGKGANQAVAAAKAGAHTTMLGRVGNDAFADPLKTFLRDMNVRVDGILEADTSTGTALIVVDDQGENTIVVVPGANGTVSKKDVTRVPFTEGDMLISQFEIPLDVVETFFLNGRQAGAITVLNPAPSMACPPPLWEAADILILNETELGFFAHEALAPNIDDAVMINKAGASVEVVGR